MSLDYVKFSGGFEKFMPKEYRDMVEHGPFGKKISVSQMGSFKEILEEHPMCAGCAMTLFIRLAIIAFPNPEDTITVGTAGCGRLAISQAAIPFVYGNCGDQERCRERTVSRAAAAVRRQAERCGRHGGRRRNGGYRLPASAPLLVSERNGSLRSCWTTKYTATPVDRRAG